MRRTLAVDLLVERIHCDCGISFVAPVGVEEPPE